MRDLNAKRPKKPITLHEAYVQKLQEHGGQRKLFIQSLLDVVVGAPEHYRYFHCSSPNKCEFCIAREEFDCRLIPDAYYIDQARCVVMAFEVEHACPMTQEKLDEYEHLWWALDAYWWGLNVISVDRQGSCRRSPVSYLDRPNGKQTLALKEVGHIDSLPMNLSDWGYNPSGDVVVSA